MWRFLGRGAHGNLGGMSGGSSLLGHGHRDSTFVIGTLEYEHSMELGDIREEIEAGGG